jgi:hypothetical protein
MSVRGGSAATVSSITALLRSCRAGCCCDGLSMRIGEVLAAAVLAAASAASAEQCTQPPPYKTPGAPAAFTFDAMPAPRLVPYPTSLQADAAYLPLAGCAIHVYGTSAEVDLLKPLAQLLAAEIKAATDGAVSMPVATVPGSAAREVAAESVTPMIMLSLSDVSAGGGAANASEAYSLSVSNDAARLTASSYAGMVAATATLLQAVERGFNVDAVPRTKLNCTTAPEWRVPVISVHDQPALPYRGIMIDAARAYLPLSALKVRAENRRFFCAIFS